ncbi:uncharacterized protein PAC_12022 [Phialocephala subalpina]|uniref:Lysophospholipase NTE1 n=1 Tax=Phialocephala subalpina TaxID=576137 RepID=A0A1L7XAT2_9HELO|nr:uncharacterized protein PAC_12022 [Phialocephala subalpina]
MADIFRSTELFQYIDDEHLEEQLEKLQILTLGKEEDMELAQEYGLVAVLEGELKVLVKYHDGAIKHYNSKEGYASPLKQGTRTAPLRVLKTIRSGESWTNMQLILSSITRDFSEDVGRSRCSKKNPLLQYRDRCDLPPASSIILRSSSTTRLAAIPLKDLLSIHAHDPSGALFLSQSIMRRLYSITFPTCYENLGLQEEVLASQKALHRMVQDESYDQSMSEKYLEWLRVFDMKADPSVEEDSSSIGPTKGIVLGQSPSVDAGSSQTCIDSRHESPKPFNVNESTGRPLLLVETPSSQGRLKPRPRIEVSDLLDKDQLLDSPEFGLFESPSLLSRTETKNAFQQNTAVLFSADKGERFADLRQHISSRIVHVLLSARAAGGDYPNNEAISMDTRDINPEINRRPSSDADIIMLESCEQNTEIAFFPRGSFLVREGERYPGLYYIIDGDLQAKSSIASSDLDDENGATNSQATFYLRRGALVGYSGLLQDNRSLYSIHAITDSYVGFIPRKHLRKIIEAHPRVFFLFAKRFLEVLPYVVGMVDHALDWLKLEPGEKVYESGEASDGFYIVLNGRLRTSQVNPITGDTVVQEVGRGQSAGALELYTSRKRPAALVAIRKSEVIRIQISTYKTLAFIHPTFAMSLAQIISASAPSLIENSVSMLSQQQGQWKLRTIAVLALSSDISADRFTHSLSESVIKTGVENSKDVITLQSESILRSLGDSSFDKRGNLRLENYLTLLEASVNITLFVGDQSPDSAWTKTCIERADIILFLGSADGCPDLTLMEKNAMKWNPLAQKSLVILNDTKPVAVSGNTRLWQETRPWAGDYVHHLKWPLSNVADASEASRSPLSSGHADIDRLTRGLFHRSIALVLGGGGARGISHLGVIKAFEEEGIPIDIVGGTSIGAFIGALYSRHLEYQKTFDDVRQFSKGMRHLRFISDLTLPVLSVTSGRAFNRRIKEFLGDQMDISDLSLNFYCTVTNLTKNGIAQPISAGRLWGPVRASMGVAGFVPPFCIDGDMLIDGCYSSNVPISNSKNMSAEAIFAIDVSDIPAFDSQNYGESVTGWELLCNRWNPFSRSPKTSTPSYTDVTERLCFTTTFAEISALKQMKDCYYLAPPVTQRATDFHRFDEIFKIGYVTAKSWLADMKASGTFPKLAIRESEPSGLT